MRDQAIDRPVDRSAGAPAAAFPPAAVPPATASPTAVSAGAVPAVVADNAVTEPFRSPGAAGNEPTEPIPAQSSDSGPTTPPGRHRPGWRDAARTHAAFAVVLLIAAAGMVRILQYHWVQGSGLIGGALLAGALFRAVLPPRRVGLLAVRSRPVDVLSYAALGVCVMFVALTIVGRPFG